MAWGSNWGHDYGLQKVHRRLTAKYRNFTQSSSSSSPAASIPAAYAAGRGARHAAEGYEEGYKKGYDEGFQRGLEAKAPLEPPPPPERPRLSLSLYERLGGIYSIATVVDDFIHKVMNDPRLNANPRVDEAHHHVPPAGFKYLVTEMLCWAAGGPQKYTGRAMKESHQHLTITAEEWEAFLDDLQQTLDKFAVPESERAEIKAIIGSTRADIVV
jgi:hemoglobin